MAKKTFASSESHDRNAVKDKSKCAFPTLTSVPTRLTVLLKIAPAFVGICGTDLHEFMGGPNFSPVKPHPVTRETIPIGMGHEFSGTILEIGEGVSGSFKVGQKCAVQPTIYCGSCGACDNGVENACPNGGFIGLSGGGGGLSDEVVVPAEAVLPLPENVELDVGGMFPFSAVVLLVSAARGKDSCFADKRQHLSNHWQSRGTLSPRHLSPLSQRIRHPLWY